MDIFPVVCALLGFVLIGPSDAKVVTLLLGSGIKGERVNFNATCNGSCEGVNVTVTALSGFLHLYGRNGSLPHPGDCNDCFCRIDDCRNISFQFSSSFAISVVADTDFENATLTVEAFNLEKTTKIPVPAKRLDLGSAKRGKRRNFKVTCYGPCEQVSAFVRGTSGHLLLHGSENSVLRLDHNRRCKDCFCESVVPWWINICQYKSLKHSSSFTVSVTAESDYVNAFLVVESINFKNIEEILSPSKLLDLSSATTGERKNFYVTCDGPCREVNVIIESGNPKLFLAEHFMPFLERSRCQNCLKDVKSVSFKDSSSFGLTALTTTSSDIVKVEAANLKDIRERDYPSKTVDGGNIAKYKAKNFHFACHGSCKELRVAVTSTINNRWTNWYVAKDDPIAYWSGYCPNCFCKKHGGNTCDFRSPKDISTFVVRVRGYYDPLANVKVKVTAFNLRV